ncbi:MAG: 2-C-methyl-D-erythritol 4-phosphate cytidylyltransferase [Candidatus Omnitrophica bacterium]|nr:2-C-methyl-D-erythritol 4-phosphate cytidylyltransferase [Candidatus Omnitrophota bacterium]MDD5238783.1 2-C-methyl-D-erythritol 4-phosphate cytidylyltransferase [Candidatus Omnitrophota bacterium]
MYVSAIVLAAGRGERFNSRISKTLIKINSKPLIVYSLITLSRHPYIRDIIVVVNTANKKGIAMAIKDYAIKKIKAIVPGGRERQDSVRLALSAIDNRTDLVLIHDAVRPFIDKAVVSSTIEQARKSSAAITGVPVKATIKELKTDYTVARTLDRNKLWEIQTPQVFKKGLILEAYKKYGKFAATDDSMLAEKLGVKVRVIKGSYFNIKITTPEDLIIAQAIQKSLRD